MSLPLERENGVKCEECHMNHKCETCHMNRIRFLSL